VLVSAAAIEIAFAAFAARLNAIRQLRIFSAIGAVSLSTR
jgi:hypothetical protein